MLEHEKRLAGLQYDPVLLSKQETQRINALSESTCFCSAEVKKGLKAASKYANKALQLSSGEIRNSIAADCTLFSDMLIAAQAGRQHTVKSMVKTHLSQDGMLYLEKACEEHKDLKKYLGDCMAACDKDEVEAKSDEEAEESKCEFEKGMKVKYKDDMYEITAVGEEYCKMKNVKNEEDEIFVKNGMFELDKVEEAVEEPVEKLEEEAAEGDTTVIAHNDEVKSEQQKAAEKDPAPKRPEGMDRDVKAVKKDLEARIDIYKDDGYNLDRSELGMLYNAIEAIEQIEALLDLENEHDFKKAQIFLTSLQNPITNLLPDSLKSHLLRGHSRKSLIDYYRDLK